MPSTSIDFDKTTAIPSLSTSPTENIGTSISQRPNFVLLDDIIISRELPYGRALISEHGEVLLNFEEAEKANTCKHISIKVT